MDCEQVLSARKGLKLQPLSPVDPKPQPPNPPSRLSPPHTHVCRLTRPHQHTVTKGSCHTEIYSVKSWYLLERL